MLDLSRLLSRAGQGAPTGIDRVELAYAQHLLAHRPDRVRFAALNRWGRVVAMPDEAARRLVVLTAQSWQAPSRGGALRRLARWLDVAMLAGRAPTDGVYLLVSHHHLNRPDAIAALRTRFVCLVHDLIPMEYPEYARPGEAAKHRLRMTTVARFADGVIANSQATRQSLLGMLDTVGRFPPVVVAPLGIDPPAASAPETGPPAPLFVCVGTIEPRKNHLLLLNLWRRFAHATTPAPHLVLVGRRGWENENIVDMLDRCDALKGLVEERRDLSDAAVAGLLRRARALLLPSFAEGYGLPLAEALALGTPVLCSDLPALREVGGDVPEYLDPLDGPGWTAAILDYAAARSPRRAAQLARLAHWRAPCWHDHMASALALVDEVAATDERQAHG